MLFAHFTALEQWIVPAFFFLGAAIGVSTTIILIRKMHQNARHSGQ